jgi:hypothetical protein
MTKMKMITERGAFEEFCPGNGTRYFLLCTEIDHDLVLCWFKNGDNGGSAFRITNHWGIAAGYLMEKMSIRLYGDALALLVYLALFHDVGIDLDSEDELIIARWNMPGSEHRNGYGLLRQLDSLKQERMLKANRKLLADKHAARVASFDTNCGCAIVGNGSGAENRRYCDEHSPESDLAGGAR